MRGVVLLALATVVVGCSTDASGLGGDIIVADSAGGEDSTFGGDETRPLFDADDDTGMIVDTGTPDTTVVVDTEIPDTAVPDTELPDTTIDVEDAIDTADTLVADSAVDDGDVSYPIDVATVDGGLISSPGQVVCNEGGIDKLCASGDVCCKTSSGYSCAGSCGTFGLGGYKCDEKSDCPGGQVCCADITPFIGTWNGSYCALTGTCFTAELCMKNADCSGSKVCTPIKPSGVPYTLGYCK